MIKIFFKITGGRPMIKQNEEGFYDSISGQKVNYYKDRLDGKEWMATSCWSIFRVERFNHEMS
jgi:hypothetical protein